MRNIDETIVRTTGQQREIFRETFGNIKGTELAVLVTEDVNIRIKANQHMVLLIPLSLTYS